MKLKYTFESVDMGDEMIAVPVGESASKMQGVLKMNREAHEIIELLKNETTEEQIISVLKEKYENDQQTITEYIQKVLFTLRNAGLIEE